MFSRHIIPPYLIYQNPKSDNYNYSPISDKSQQYFMIDRNRHFVR